MEAALAALAALELLYPTTLKLGVSRRQALASSRWPLEAEGSRCVCDPFELEIIRLTALSGSCDTEEDHSSSNTN